MILTHSSKARIAGSRLVATTLMASSFACAFATLNVYVSPTGNDASNGQTAATAVATIAKAVNLVAKYRPVTTSEPAIIWMASGKYYFSACQYLDQTVSNLTIESSGTAPARLIGGVPLTNWQLVSDTATLKRLAPGMVGRAYRCGLTALNTTIGSFSQRNSYAYDSTDSPMEVELNGTMGIPATYPKGSWMPVTPGSNSGPYSTEFKTIDPLVLGFSQEPNMLAHGYFGNLWSDSIEPVQSINASTGGVTLSGAGQYYGFNTIGRWRLENVLPQLTATNEYYLDQATNSVIMINPTSTQEIIGSTLQKPIFTLSGATNVTFQGLSIESTRDDGILVETGAGMTINYCNFQNLGKNGVELQNGLNCTIENSTFTRMGEVGVVLMGGDRVALTPGNNVVQNCVFTNCGQDIHNYRPSIRMEGVGNTVQHNTISGNFGQGIMVQGNNELIQNNEVYNVLTEVGDCGAIYMGRNVTEQGNVVKNNLIHDVHTLPGFPPYYWDNFAIYLDDLESGFTVTGNVITNCTAGIIVGGGRNNTISANVFNNVPHAFELDARGMTWETSYYAPGGTFQQQVAAVNAFGPIYTAAYPNLKTLLQQNYQMPGNNTITCSTSATSNTILGSTAQTAWIMFADSIAASGFSLPNNLLGINPNFVNPSIYDFRLQPGSPAEGLGLSQLTQASVGSSLAASSKNAA